MRAPSPGSYRQIWLVAYPLILTNASHSIMQFADRKFLSMNSTADVAAALPSGILCFTMFSFFLVSTGFTAAIVSQYEGMKAYLAGARAPWAGFFYALVAGLLCSYAMLPLGEWLIERGGHSPDIIGKELEYFRTLMPGAGLVCAGAACCAFFSGRGKTWTVAIIQCSGCALNIALDYIMIFGKCGFPALGITGAGLATTLSAGFSFLLALIALLLVDQKTYPTRACFTQVRYPEIRRLMLFGMPCGVEIFCEVGAFTFVVFLIGQLGDDALTASTICLSINGLSFLPLLGLADATCVLSGRYIGEKKPEISERTAYHSWVMATLYMVFVGVFFVAFPNALFNYFSPTTQGADFSEVMSYARPLLLCVTVYNFFDATLFVFRGALRGAGDTRFTMCVGVLCAWLLMAPGVCLLIFGFKTGVVSVWAYLSAYILVTALIVFFRYRSGAWKKIKMIERAPAPPPLDRVVPEPDVY